MNALLVLNGELPKKNKVLQLIKTHPHIVCADGGANGLISLNIKPDVIVGDLDSVSAKTLSKCSRSLVIRQSHQDQSDFEKSLSYLKQNHFKSICVVGGSGHRTDHAFCNHALSFAWLKYFDLHFYEKTFRIYPIDKARSFKARPKSIVSVLPFGQVLGLKYKGLHYQNLKTIISFTNVLQSNFNTRPSFRIDFKRGRLLVFVEHHNA